MIFDTNSNDRCFVDLPPNDSRSSVVHSRDQEDTRQFKAMDTTSNSPPSLPELNIVASPVSQRQSTESPIAPSGTTNSHTEEESTKKILKCDYCDKTFTLANVLKVHQRIHTGEKPYVCEICGKAFNQSGSLNRHRNTHRYRDATDNNFVCRFCSAKFPHGSLLESHEKTAHHNRRTGRPRNLSSLENNINILPNETFPKFGYSTGFGLAARDAKNEKLSPIPNDDPVGSNESNVPNKDYPTRPGCNNEFAFSCPYCQLNFNDIREFGVHLSQHTLSGNLVSGTTGISSPTNPLLGKTNPIFTSESFVHQLSTLSKKFKLPAADFNPNIGLGSVSSSSFIPVSFDRLRPIDTLSNMNFPLSNANPNITTNNPLLSDSYNLAAFVLATLSKDCLYKLRGQPPHQDNNFSITNPEFLKTQVFSAKSPLLGTVPNSNNVDFYSLFNIQKPLQNIFNNIDNNSSVPPNTKVENDTNNCLNIEMHDKNYNIISSTPSRTSSSPSIFLSRSNGKDVMNVNNGRKSTVNRSSPVSGNQTLQTSNKNDVFYSRKSAAERRKCPDCDKQFTCESALRIHYRKHSGERPYACEFCSKTFSQNGTLKRHHLTCKNRPSLLSNSKVKVSSNKSTLPQDPDSTQEVINTNNAAATNYKISNSPSNAFTANSLTNSSNHPLSYIMNNKALTTKLNETLNKFDHLSSNSIFQPVTSYPVGENLIKNSEIMPSFISSLVAAEEPTDLTINGNRNDDAISHIGEEDNVLDIDSVEDCKNNNSLKCENNNFRENETKLVLNSSFLESNNDPSLEDDSRNVHNFIYNFSTKEILKQLVSNGRLMMCQHCAIYFENEKTYINHIKIHSEEKGNLECRDCNFVAKDELAFKDHFNNLGILSNNL